MNNMKAEDLQIGDWVNLYDSPIKINIDDLGVIERDETYDKGVHCEPIPLTDEILKKNGFVYDENREAWEQIPNDGYGICYEDNTYLFSLGVFDPFNRDSDITYHTIAEIKYIHELQHALKLCKIDKEIIV